MHSPTTTRQLPEPVPSHTINLERLTKCACSLWLGRQCNDAGDILLGALSKVSMASDMFDGKSVNLMDELSWKP